MRWWTDSQNFATSFLQARRERRICRCQAISDSPEEPDRILRHRCIHLKTRTDSAASCASEANFNVRVCLITFIMADSATPVVACSPTSFFHKTNSTSGAANKFAELRSTIAGSPSLCNAAVAHLLCCKIHGTETKPTLHVSSFAASAFGAEFVFSKGLPHSCGVRDKTERVKKHVGHFSR